MADWVLRRREYFEQNAGSRHFGLLIVALFGAIMFLHLIQTSLWAAFYYTQGLFSDLV